MYSNWSTLLSAVSLIAHWIATDSIRNEAGSGRPSIVEHPLDTIVAKGEPVTLNCKAEGNPTPEIFWYRDGGSVSVAREESSSHRILLPTGSLFFLKVLSGKSAGDSKDPGTYWCVAKNRFGEARSRNASLRVASLHDTFQVAPRNAQTTVGKRAVLECAPPKGFPEPIVSWKKEEEELRPDEDERLTVHSSGNLVISRVRPADSGFYSCVAENMVGRRESASARLSVFEKPRFVKRPGDMTADVGDDVLFHCRVSGDPTPVIVWTKKQSVIPMTRAKIIETKGLQIDRIVAGDEGEYICSAKNPAGKIEAAAVLTVQAAPVFRRKPQDRTVEEGGTAWFDCEATGSPMPTRYWTKRSGNQNLMFVGHVSADGRMTVSADARMTITNVGPEDQGSYFCTAINAAGSNMVQAELRVAGISMAASPPPIIIQGPANQTVALKSQVLLPCKISGVGAEVSWLKSGRPIDFKALKVRDRYRLLNTGSLEISSLRSADSAIYTCQADSANGRATWSASLTAEDHTKADVIFKRMADPSNFPSSPGRPTLLNASETTVTLKWSVPNKQGASRIQGYILQYFSPELEKTWYNVDAYIRKPIYTVANIKPSSSYVFIVRAENNDGIGDPSPISALIRTAAKEKGAASESGEERDTFFAAGQLIKLLQVKVINATAMQLVWRRTESTRQIAGYYVKWRGGASGSSARRQSWVRVTNPMSRSAVVGNLEAYTTYTFFVIPYSVGGVEGKPSNSLDGTTDEAPPSAPPANVVVRMRNLTTLTISWRPPSADRLNGILKGYLIWVRPSRANSSSTFAEADKNITTNERAASVTLFRLVPAMTYTVRVAAFTGAGVGVFHGVDKVTMDRETLSRHLAMYDDADSVDLLGMLMNILGVVVAVALVVCLVFGMCVGLVCWQRKCSSKSGSTAHMGPFIKITDGSVDSARAHLWLDHAALYSAHHHQQQQQQQQHVLANSNAEFGYDPQTDYLTNGEFVGPPPDYTSYTLGRLPANSPYVQLASQQNLTTFHQGNTPFAEPSPYATTTLVMNGHGRNMLGQLKQTTSPRPPMLLPSRPPPPNPPPGFGPTVAAKNSDSPPTTEFSYLNSDEQGTGSSGTSQRQEGARRTPQSALLDLLPPPPSQEPPRGQRLLSNERTQKTNGSTPPKRLEKSSKKGNDDSMPIARDNEYETMNDAMLRSFNSSSPKNSRGGRFSPRSSTVFENDAESRTSSINDTKYDAGRTNSGSSGADDEEERDDGEDDDVQCCLGSPSASDEESELHNADHNPNFAQALAARGLLPEHATAQRRQQPCMGASALTKSTYDSLSPKQRETSRNGLQRIDRTPAVETDLYKERHDFV